MQRRKVHCGVKIVFTTLTLIFFAVGTATSQDAKLPRGCLVELGGANLVHWNILCAAISPNGRLAATGDEGTYANPHTGGDWIEGCVRVWDTTSGRLAQEIRDAGLVQALAFSPDASLVAAIDGKGKANVRIWTVADGKLLHTISAEGGIGNELVFSPDSRLLATGGDDYGVKILEIATGRIRDVPSEMRGRTQFTPDSKALWGIGDSSLVRFSLADWRTDSRTVAHSPVKLLDLAISPDGKSVATIDDARHVCIHDAQELARRETWRVEDHEEAVPWIAWSAMGHEIITVSSKGSITTWSGDTRTPRRLIPPALRLPLAISQSANKMLAATNPSESLSVVNLATGGALTIPRPGQALSVSPSGRRVVTFGDSVLQVFNAESGRHEAKLGCEEEEKEAAAAELDDVDDYLAGLGFLSAQFVGDDSIVAARGGVYAWRWKDSKWRRETLLPRRKLGGYADFACISPDEKLLVVNEVARRGDRLRLFEMPRGEAVATLATLPPLAGLFATVAFSVDGKRLYFVTVDPTPDGDTQSESLRVWDVERRALHHQRLTIREKIEEVYEQKRGLYAGTISLGSPGAPLIFAEVVPAGERILVTGAAGWVKLLDAETLVEEPLTVPDGFKVHTATVGAKGKLAALGGCDGRVAIIDLDRGKQLATFMPHDPSMLLERIVLSDNGQLLTTMAVVNWRAWNKKTDAEPMINAPSSSVRIWRVEELLKPRG